MLIGIVGKPSSGKSTFLNAACLTNAKTANYPFTTIEPNLGTSYVRVPCVCKELGINDNPKNSLCFEKNRLIPIKMLDVAGLVPDAHKGKGMGNKFLSDLSRADALIHVIDISGSLDSEGQEIQEGHQDPLNDIIFLENEINFWFKDIIAAKDWSKFIRKIEQDKLSFSETLYERMAGISVKKTHILKAMEESKLDYEHLTNWTDDDLLLFSTNLRKISKPIIIAANKIDKPKSAEIYTELRKKYVGNIVPCSALAEYWLRKSEEQGTIKYIPGDSKFVINENVELKPNDSAALNNIQNKILDLYGNSGIQEILNHTVFNVLNQIVVYPVYDLQNYSDKDGNVLPDAHLVSKGIKLKEFIEQKIHSDLAKNFIYGINGRTKMRLGESYELQNNDIVKVVSAAK